MHELRNKLIQTFILIKEWEKIINEDIMQIIQLPSLDCAQRKYLESLIEGLNSLSQKIKKKISQIQNEYGFNGKPFIINKKVNELLINRIM